MRESSPNAKPAPRVAARLDGLRSSWPLRIAPCGPRRKQVQGARGSRYTRSKNAMNSNANRTTTSSAVQDTTAAVQDRLLTQEEVLGMLSLSRPSLQRMVLAGMLAKVPLGARMVRYRLSDVQRIVREGFKA